MTVPWVRTTRRASGLIEHICEHGCGHPAFGSVHWHDIQGVYGMGVHGCDGCCTKQEWIIADLQEGVRVANDKLLATIKHLAAIAQSEQAIKKEAASEVVEVKAAMCFNCGLVTTKSPCEWCGATKS